MTYYSALHYAAKAEAAATTATTLLPYLTDITTVATNIASVNTVSTNISDITTAATNISSINTVATNISDVNSVVSNATNINTVATNISDVNTVATDISNVNSVAGDLTNIDAVNANKTNIDAVAGNETNINAVASNETNINTVAGDTTSINAVASDLTNINSVAADLTNIDNASTYAAEAKQWAIGDPTEPVDGSAKYWAQQAAGQVIPSQTGHSGEYLTTDGSVLSWNNVDALPDQTGQSGKFLTTDGTDASWTTVSVTVDQVYDSTSANAQSGVAINGAKFIQNTATGSGSISAGSNSSATGTNAVAFGFYAQAHANGALQIGQGQNTIANTFQVGSYRLLDTSTGIIPYQRINAITDSNAGGQLKVWSGDEADLPVSKDSNTFYATEETVSVSLLETLYPVGSIYITTNATCPLSTLIAGSTWVQETSRILVDKGSSGTDWWELYSDGWCRQGGVYTKATGAANAVTIDLHKSFNSTDYNIIAVAKSNGAATIDCYDLQINPSNTTTSSFSIGMGANSAYWTGAYWWACGYTSTTTTHKRFRRTA